MFSQVNDEDDADSGQEISAADTSQVSQVGQQSMYTTDLPCLHFGGICIQLSRAPLLFSLGIT